MYVCIFIYICMYVCIFEKRAMSRRRMRATTRRSRCLNRATKELAAQQDFVYALLRDFCTHTHFYVFIYLIIYLYMYIYIVLRATHHHACSLYLRFHVFYHTYHTLTLLFIIIIFFLFEEKNNRYVYHICINTMNGMSKLVAQSILEEGRSCE